MLQNIFSYRPSLQNLFKNLPSYQEALCFTNFLHVTFTLGPQLLGKQ